MGPVSRLNIISILYIYKIFKKNSLLLYGIYYTPRLVGHMCYESYLRNVWVVWFANQWIGKWIGPMTWARHCIMLAVFFHCMFFTRNILRSTLHLSSTNTPYSSICYRSLLQQYLPWMPLTLVSAIDGPSIVSATRGQFSRKQLQITEVCRRFNKKCIPEDWHTMPNNTSIKCSYSMALRYPNI